MKRSVCKEWDRADATKRSSASAMNQSHRDATPVTAHSVSKQSTRRSRDPRLAASLHTLPIQQHTPMIQPAVSPNRRVTILKIAGKDPRYGLPLLFSHSVELTSHDTATQPVPAIQQQAAMISFPPGVRIHTFRVTTDPRDGHFVILSHTVEVTGHAPSPSSVVDPSNSTKGQPSCNNMKAREARADDDQTTVRMMFKTALKKFVTKQIQKTRDQRQSKKELRDIIVQKTVDNIMRLEKNIPRTVKRIGKYLIHCKGKIKKLIQEYFHMYEAKSHR